MFIVLVTGEYYYIFCIHYKYQCTKEYSSIHMNDLHILAVFHSGNIGIELSL